MSYIDRYNPFKKPFSPDKKLFLAGAMVSAASLAIPSLFNKQSSRRFDASPTPIAYTEVLRSIPFIGSAHNAADVDLSHDPTKFDQYLQSLAWAVELDISYDDLTGKLMVAHDINGLRQEIIMQKDSYPNLSDIQWLPNLAARAIAAGKHFNFDTKESTNNPIAEELMIDFFNSPLMNNPSTIKFLSGTAYEHLNRVKHGAPDLFSLFTVNGIDKGWDDFHKFTKSMSSDDIQTSGVSVKFDQITQDALTNIRNQGSFSLVYDISNAGQIATAKAFGAGGVTLDSIFDLNNLAAAA